MFDWLTCSPRSTKVSQFFYFEPFRQEDGSSTRKYGGTGLGLSVAKHLTELMDGRISLESEIGQGSAFIVLLPLDEPVPEHPPSYAWSSLAVTTRYCR